MDCSLHVKTQHLQLFFFYCKEKFPIVSQLYKPCQKKRSVNIKNVKLQITVNSIIYMEIKLSFSFS